MKHHICTKPKRLSEERTELYQHVKGKPRLNPVTITNMDGLKLDKPKATIQDAGQKRLIDAFNRDSVYSSTGAVFLRAYGLRQAFRELSDFGAELHKAGMGETQ